MMKCFLVSIGIIAMAMWNVSANSLASGRLSSKKIIGNIKNQLHTLQTVINNIAKGQCDNVVTKEPYGAVYTRWGHNGCPESRTKLVYSGYAGGAWYDFPGGAADYICLTGTPTQYNNRNKYDGGYGYLFGGEYQFGGSNSKYQQDAPCAVCQSVSRTSAIMLPGSDVCPKGWYLEYKGLLMSGYHSHKAASQHICVDHATKTLRDGSANQNGKLFYPVKTRCGTLRCPPYKNDKFVTCAVCTR